MAHGYYSNLCRKAIIFLGDLDMLDLWLGHQVTKCPYSCLFAYLDDLHQLSIHTDLKYKGLNDIDYRVKIKTKIY